MSTALVPVYAGRPPWVLSDDGWICVSIYDAAYLRERSLWRVRLRQASGARRYQALVRRYREWQTAHERQYRAWGLTPPLGALGAGSRGPYRARGLPRRTADERRAHRFGRWWTVKVAGTPFYALPAQDQTRLFRQFAEWLASRGAP